MTSHTLSLSQELRRSYAEFEAVHERGEKGTDKGGQFVSKGDRGVALEHGELESAIGETEQATEQAPPNPMVVTTKSKGGGGAGGGIFIALGIIFAFLVWGGVAYLYYECLLPPDVKVFKWY